MAGRQILPMVDLRTGAEKQGITKNQQTAQAIAGILQGLGEAEQVRRERDTLDQIARSLLAGATITEATEAASRQGTQFSKGFSGGLQKFAGGFQPSPGNVEGGINQTIISAKLRELLDPSAKLETEYLKSRIEATDALTEQRQNPKTNATAPFQRTPEEKAYEVDIKKVMDDKLPEGIKRQALQRLKLNPAAQTPIESGRWDDAYKKLVKGVDKTERANKWYAKADEVYPYWESLATVISNGTAKGLSAASIEADFNRWWDEQYEKEEGQSYQKFAKRPGYGEEAGGTALDETTAGAILREAGGDKEKARKIATQRGYKF